MSAIVLSSIALAISLISAIYAAKSVRASQRKLRGEMDAARTTYFQLEIPSPSYVIRLGIETPPPEYSIHARNAGDADARNVSLVVRAKEDGRVWSESKEILAAGDQIQANVGRLGDRRTFVTQVSWRDGRWLRQRYSRSLQPEG